MATASSRFALSFVFFTFIPGPLLAQTTATPNRATVTKSAEATRATALERYKYGVALAKRQKWVQARNEFKKALKLYKDAPTTYALARTYYKLGQYVTARETLQQMDSLAKDVSLRQAAKELEKGIDKRISVLDLTVAPRTALVKVDKRRVKLAKGQASLPLNPGQHEIEATATGYAPYLHTVTLHRGAHKNFVIKMYQDRLNGALAEGNGPNTNRPNGSPQGPRRAPGGISPLAGILLGTASAGLIAAAVVAMQ